MDDWMKAMEALTKAWNKFGTTVKEMADALTEAFGFREPEKEKKRSLSSPARYGMSLQKSKITSLMKRYSYYPIARKHLPYQRRNH